MAATDVWGLLEQVTDPILGENIVDLGLVVDCQVTGETVAVTLFSGGGAAPAEAAIARQVFDVLENAGYAVELDAVQTPVKTFPHRDPDDDDVPIINPDVSNYIPIVGPRGGVGRSTLAVNLATSLAVRDIPVGLVDLDLTFPTLISRLPEWGGKMDIAADGSANPTTRKDLKPLSVGALEKADIADEHLDIRNPSTEHRKEILHHLLMYPEWGDLDYLILDLPADVFNATMSTIHDLSHPGAVLVTTPRIGAIEGAKRYASTVTHARAEENAELAVGVVENMSGAVCPACETVVTPPTSSNERESCRVCGGELLEDEMCADCGWVYPNRVEAPTVECPDCGTAMTAVQTGGGRGLAKFMDVPFFGRIPVDPAIRKKTTREADPAIFGTSPGGEALGMVTDNIIDAVAAHTRLKFGESRRGVPQPEMDRWLQEAREAVAAERSVRSREEFESSGGATVE